YIVFLQAEDGIRDRNVTGVQTCALPISQVRLDEGDRRDEDDPEPLDRDGEGFGERLQVLEHDSISPDAGAARFLLSEEISPHQWEIERGSAFGVQSRSGRKARVTTSTTMTTASRTHPGRPTADPISGFSSGVAQRSG